MDPSRKVQWAELSSFWMQFAFNTFVQMSTCIIITLCDGALAPLMVKIYCAVANVNS